MDKARKKSEESASSSSGRKRKSALDENMEMEENQKKKIQKKFDDSSRDKMRDQWLMRRIVVKVVTPKLGEKYYRKKGVVVDIVGDNV